MNIKSVFSVFLCVAALFFSQELQAMRSKSFKSPEEAERYLNDHHGKACKYYSEKKWKDASSEFERVVYFFPDSEIAAKAYFYLAVCYFEMKEFDFANLEFTNYLKASEHPKFFEETIYYKFYIAEYFKAGGKRHYFTFRYTPKWASASSTAVTIYDEIIMTVPNHEYAAASLYSKGSLLHSMGEYRDAIESLQTLIRRFPKHELTPQAYLDIAQNYCELSRYEFQNPDILALSELNARKFREDFSRDEKVETVDGYVSKIKEIYAKGLCDIGLFYERLGKPGAAAIYYQSCIEEFPTTAIAILSRKRLAILGEVSLENKAEGLSPAINIVEPSSDVESQIESVESSS
jgi:TolA-binding protein